MRSRQVESATGGTAGRRYGAANLLSTGPACARPAAAGGREPAWALTRPRPAIRR
jgi:hypothetical protein